MHWWSSKGESDGHSVKPLITPAASTKPAWSFSKASYSSSSELNWQPKLSFKGKHLLLVSVKRRQQIFAYHSKRLSLDWNCTRVPNCKLVYYYTVQQWLLAIKNEFWPFFEDFPGYFEDFSAVKITAKSSESAGKTF